MEIQKYTVVTTDGRAINIENKRFTDEELAEMPEHHRNAILAFRKLFVDKPEYYDILVENGG